MHFGPVSALLGPKSVIFAQKRTFGPEIAFGAKRGGISSINDWFYKHPRHGVQKACFPRKVQLSGTNIVKDIKTILGAKKAFEQKSALFGAPVGQVAKKITCM